MNLKIIASSIISIGLGFSIPASAQVTPDDLYRETALYQHSGYVSNATSIFCNSLESGYNEETAFRKASIYYYSQTASLFGVSTTTFINSISEQAISIYVEILFTSAMTECPSEITNYERVED